MSLCAPEMTAVRLRPVRESDAGELSRLYLANREYLRPWEPTGDASYFTLEGQRANLRDLVQAHASG